MQNSHPKTNHPSTSHTNTKGFGLIGVLLVILVVAATGGAGVYVYHRNHKAKHVATTSKSSTSTSSQAKPTPRTEDPYAGWKTYTDTTYHYSFRYPAGWELTTNGAQGVAISLRNPSNSVLISYANPLVKDGGSGDFLAADIQSVTTNAGLKVVGGAFTANNLPTYSVVNASLLTTYPLVIGQTSQFEMAARFSDQGSNDNGQLMAYPVGASFTTAAQAEAWFTTTDAKTSLLIMESLTYQP